MSKKQLLFLFLIMAALTLGMLWLLRDMLRPLFTVPVWYLVWLVTLVINSIDQRYYWVVLVIVVLVLSNRSLRRSKKETSSAAQDPNPRSSKVGPLAQRAGQVRQALQEGRYTSYSSYHIRRLLLAVVAYSEGEPVEEVERLLWQGELDLPPEVLVVLKTKEGLSYHHRAALWMKLKSFITGLLRGSAEKPGDFYHEMERVVAYMEAQLEVKHDHGNT